MKFLNQMLNTASGKQIQQVNNGDDVEAIGEFEIVNNINMDNIEEDLGQDYDYEQVEKEQDSRPSDSIHGSIKCVSKEKQNEDDELVAVVITIRYGSSYDSLFTSVQQKAPDGSHVAVYLVQDISAKDLSDIWKQKQNTAMKDVMDRLKAKYGGDAENMLRDIASIDAESVVFNWECCSGCGGDSFPAPAKNTVNMISQLVKEGYMVMCADFSLKALISCWDKDALGENPFRQVETFSGSVDLRFNPQRLKLCEDSAQLQILGELCESGQASVSALGGTIVFAVDSEITASASQERSENSWSDIEVLTIATKLGGLSADSFSAKTAEISSIDRVTGLAAHCLLTYPSGGKILVSCPHWIELSQLDEVTTERLQDIATERFGEDYCAGMVAEEQAIEGEEERRNFRAKISKQFVQQSAPGRFMKKSKK